MHGYKWPINLPRTRTAEHPPHVTATAALRLHHQHQTDTPPFSQPLSPELAEEGQAVRAVSTTSPPPPLAGAALAKALAALNSLPPTERALAAQKLLGPKKPKRVQKPRRNLNAATATAEGNARIENVGKSQSCMVSREAEVTTAASAKTGKAQSTTLYWEV